MPSSYTETNVLLDIKGVNLTLGENHILDGVDLTVRDIKQAGAVRGQVRCILGPSGVGKTQLIRIIAGLNKPDSGTVQVSNDGVNLEPVEAGMIGVVGQSYPLFDHLTVLQNLVLAGKVSNLSGKEADEKAWDLLKRFGLANHASFWPSQLSGGQRQRVAIIQQIMVNRIFLIMDEPFSGLDPKALNSVINLIEEIATSNELNTVIIITHDIRAAAIIADYIHLLGRQFDKEGNMVRGAHFIETLNLVEMGLAWQKDIRKNPKLNLLINEIEDKFEGI